MKENVHRGAHALTGLMFAPSLICFDNCTIGLILLSCNFFLHLHFITTSLNNRRQLNDNDLPPN